MVRENKGRGSGGMTREQAHVKKEKEKFYKDEVKESEVGEKNCGK